MRLRLEYAGPEGEPFDVPDANLASVLEPRAAAEPRDLDRVAADALAAPTGAPPLAEAAAGAARVLVLVDDATRATPVAALLPHVARELEAAGVEDDAVTVLTAPGTHRRVTDDELALKLGPFRNRWRVEQHDYRDRDRLHDFGETRGGMPVIANRLLADADFALGIGHVGVHGIMGYSGGAKIAFPGICGHESEAWTHWNASLLPIEEMMGVIETPMRHAIEEAATMAGLDAVMNVAMDRTGAVAHAAYGHFVDAQRACARVARDLWSAPLAREADVVVVEARPADRDYWQSVKGLYAAYPVVREGGVVVLVAPNPEGVADNHPNVLELAGLTSQEIRTRVEEERVDDNIGAAVAHYTARVRERADVLLVSSGVGDADARRLGFTPHRRVQGAVDDALGRAGRDADVVVIRHGGGTLPVVGGRNADAVRRGRSSEAVTTAVLSE